MGIVGEMQIVRAAVTQFAKNGYYGTSTREIAKAAGINEVTLFRVFSNKRNLYLKALEAAVRDIMPPTDLHSSQARPLGVSRAALEHTLAITCDCLTSSPESCRLVYFGLLDNSKDVTRRLRSHLEEYVNAVACCLFPEAIDGTIRCQSPKRFVVTLLAIAINDGPLGRVFLSGTTPIDPSLLKGILAQRPI